MWRFARAGNCIKFQQRYAALRIRIDRWRLQNLRRQIYFEPTGHAAAAGEMSALPQARSQGHFQFQFAHEAQTAIDYGRKESGFHGV